MGNRKDNMYTVNYRCTGIIVHKCYNYSHMTSHDSLSHLEPDDVTSNHNSNALNQISDDVDECSPHVDVLIALSCPFLVFAGLCCS